ncbi:MAG: hypothetical protein WCW84_07550 [Sulfurimonas sp.]|jgi:hypothetical protein
MIEKNTKRAAIPTADYYTAEEIGKALLAGDTSGFLSKEGKDNEVGLGISWALEHYLKTKDVDVQLYEKLLRLKDIDVSVSNNINAIQTLGKNEGFTDEEIKEKVNTALKTVIIGIVGGS